MKSDFLLAITQLSAEKNLPKEVVIGAVEAALASAYRKDSFTPEQNISVRINPDSGKVEVWAEKVVVEKKPSDSRCQISLKAAREINPEAQVDDVIEVEATPHNAGRIAAQTAKQVILQRLHEAEHNAIFEEYAGKEGDVVTGMVQHIEGGQVFIDLGRAEAVLPISEQVRNERYHIGQRLKVYLLEVARLTKGSRVVVSRSHPNLVRRLFELEVPEVLNGIVEIKSVAREAGYRTKVAVAARQEGIDPVGCCVGLRGIRIQNIVSELGGEKLDVVMWHEDTSVFIANALSPAKVVGTELREEEEMAIVVVPDRQLSLAIGKEGQNARLAAKLTGWRIEIKSASAFAAEKEAKAEPEPVVEPEAEVEAGAEVEAEVAVEVAEPEPVVEAEIADEVPLEVEAEVEEDKEEEEVEAEAEAPEPIAVEAAFTLEQAPFKPQVVEGGKGQIRFSEDIMGAGPSRGGSKTKGKKKKRAKGKEKDDDTGRGRKRRADSAIVIDDEF